jgi:ABC-type sugar transport system ATPase subunit
MNSKDAIIEPLVQLKDVGKHYAGVWVLQDATFSVSPGEVVALVGENGAGKSTLKNILCGLIAPDAGSLIFQGTEYDRLTSKDSRDLGIAAIHQELSLFPNLSIAENIYMGVGSLPTRFGLLDTTAMDSGSLHLLGDLIETEVDPGMIVERLSLGERQLVEIAKALGRASTMLILDEPTTSLSLPERHRLFEVVRRLRERGYALVYITHFLEEVYELADRIVVLRDGKMVGTGTTDEIGPKLLPQLMVGRELAEVDADLSSVALEVQSGGSDENVLLRVRDLSDASLLKGISLDVRAGEILGLGGLMGAGRSEVAEAIFGVTSAEGTVEIEGIPFEERSPEAAKARGVALVSEDRREDQVFPGRSVRENLTSAILDLLKSGFGYLGPGRQRLRAEELVSEFGIRSPGLEAPMVALSGGNQQRAVIARWLAKRPVVCILDEPTKGIDVGAKAEIHRLINRLANEGLGVLLISSDLPELVALSHRILVLHKGQVVGELQRSEFNPATIVEMASTGRAA